MGRPPCCDRSNVKRGLWTAEEDAKILAYVSSHGVGNWTMVPMKAGLNRCGKSCRLRWTNYLRPDLKHDSFTPEEEELIIKLHKAIGSRWSLIAKQLPGRTDNDVKNYWNTKLRKKLKKMGIDPVTHKPFSQIFMDYGNISGVLNTASHIGSLNNHFMSKPEQSSVFSGPSVSSMVTQSMMEQIQEISSASNYPSWETLPQFPVTIPKKMEPHFFNDASSSSSSTTFAHLSPQQSYSFQQTQTQIAQSSPFAWSEFLLNDPASSAEFQQQEQDFYGSLSSTNPSSVKHSNISCFKYAAGNGIHYNNGAGRKCFRGDDCGAMDGNEANSFVDACSASGSSFVDGILDKDREMRSQFPEILDHSFDY